MRELGEREREGRCERARSEGDAGSERERGNERGAVAAAGETRGRVNETRCPNP